MQSGNFLVKTIRFLVDRVCFLVRNFHCLMYSVYFLVRKFHCLIEKLNCFGLSYELCVMSYDLRWSKLGFYRKLLNKCDFVLNLAL